MDAAVRPLRLLLVEDDARDAELVAKALNSAGIRFTIDRVQDEAGYRAALAAGCPDAILSNWALPRFSGEDALTIARQRFAHVPFIFLAGTAPVTVALDTLRHAAVDYVSKQQLAMLPLVLGLVVEEAGRREDMLRTMSRLRDANERLRLTQERLVQSEKMAAVGQLAAGVAHELNTPLAYVKSNLGSLHAYVGSLLKIIDAYQRNADPLACEREEDFEFIKTDVVPLIGQSQEGIERARRIVLDLKGFVRPEGAQDWQLADLNAELDRALNLVWNELKYKCVLRKEYGELPPVRCLPNRIGQIFVNLLVNAGQAIEKHGEITLCTMRVGGEIRIEVGDTGSGIAPEHVEQIFQPFFTTKPNGVGTGLGLAVSADIAAQHGGRIEVRSEPGRGTAFTLALPVASLIPDAADHAATAPPAPAVAPAAVRQSPFDATETTTALSNRS